MSILEVSGKTPDMPKLLAGVRGTVQGLLVASMHALWYVDWHTGGAAVRDRAA